MLTTRNCAKTEALLPKKNGNGWALAVKDAEAWGRAALVAEPVPDVAAMARDKRRERRRSKGDAKADSKRAAAIKKKEATSAHEEWVESRRSRLDKK